MAGLLFVYVEKGENISEAEFNDWYDNEHVPARIAVPGFSSVARYKAEDGKSPTWLATYDLETPATLETPAYKGLAAQASERERQLMPRLEILNRRVYECTYQLPESADSVDLSGVNYGWVVTTLVKPEVEDEFNALCNDHQVPDISKIPGWVRTRRFKLVSNIELNANAEDKPVHNYLTIHDFTRNDYLQSREYAAVAGTPALEAFRPKLSGLEHRHFVIHKRFN